MKGIVKISAFALSLLTLASCTSDDFFGGSNMNGKKQLVVSVEAPDGGMRSAYDPTNDMKPYWEVGDVFRVYDAALQKYDRFQFDGSAVVLAGETENVQGHAYAIFPGNMVYKAGWDETNGVTATMEIPSNYTCGNVIVDNGVSYYGSQLPQYGTVEEEGDHLKTQLSWLTAFTDIVVYNQKAKAIRVLALDKDADDTKTKALSDITQFDFAQNGDLNTPLSGYFDAQLKENGILVADQTNPMTKAGYKGYIAVNLKNNTADEAHVFIPIVPGTYENLVIQYTEQDCADETALLAETSWVDVRDAIKDKTIARKAIVGGEIGTAPKKAKAISLSDLERILKSTDQGTISGDDDYAAQGDVLNVELGGELKTEAEGTGTQYWLDLPADKNLIVNIEGGITNALTTRPFTILGGANSKIVLNVKGGIAGSESIIINTAPTCELILGGEFKSTGSGSNIKVAYANSDLTSKGSTDQAAKVTLGYGDFAPFKTVMDVMVKNNATEVTVDAGKNGSIAKIDFDGNNSAKLTINSGAVTAIGGSKAGSGDLTVNENVTVENITARGKVTIKAEVGTLTLDANNMSEISLVGSTDGSTLAKIGTLDIKGKESPVVTSSGKAALIKVINENSDPEKKATYTSKWDGKKIATAEINEAGEIYTAAQLGGIVAGKAYKLMTPVTAFEAEWTPVALNGNFDGNKLTLTGLNAALFSNVTGGTIKNLTLTNVNINNKKSNQGALAQVVNGTVTISGVIVSSGTVGATTGDKNTKNIGGLVGIASGAVTLNDNQVTATVQGYANVGGYIGNFAGGSILFKYTGTTAKVSNVTYASSFTNEEEEAKGTDMNCGTFGHFIGSITSAASTVQVQKKTDALGAKFDDYFTETIDSNKDDELNFNHNKDYNEAGTQYREFVGRAKHEIGYCPVDEITKLELYNVDRDQLGNDIIQTIEKDVDLYTDWMDVQ